MDRYNFDIAQKYCDLICNAERQILSELRYIQKLHRIYLQTYKYR